MNIFVIFVKKSGIQSTGSIIVQTSIFLLIPIAFLEYVHISSLRGMNIPSIWLTRARTPIVYVMNVVVFAMAWLINVSIVISIFTGGAFTRLQNKQDWQSLGGMNIPSSCLTRARASIVNVITVVIFAMARVMDVSIVISVFTGGALTRLRTELTSLADWYFSITSQI
jgi:hypothetical protein